MNSVLQQQLFNGYLAVVSIPNLPPSAKREAAGDLICFDGTGYLPIRELYEKCEKEVDYSQIWEVYEERLVRRLYRLAEKLETKLESEALLIFAGYETVDFAALGSAAGEARREAYDALYGDCENDDEFYGDGEDED